MNETQTAPLPARMLNEFVYCPRLFYLMHVEGIFVENADTLEGSAQHKRVDAGNGRLPPAKKQAKVDAQADANSDATTDNYKPEVSAVPNPQSEMDTIHSRSVSLFSDELGVSAKLDLVESTNVEGDLFSAREYTPVEYKKGAPREGDEGYELWPTDRMQLGLQMLLLRENHYPCREGIIYYREARKRVRFELDDEDERWIRENIIQARACCDGARPPPLDDSPKCPRCSLVSVCLPDETRLLQEHAEHRRDLNGDSQLSLEMALPTQGRLDRNPFADFPEVRLPRLKPGQDVRRLIAPAHDTRALYVNTPGLFVGKKGEQLVVKEKKKIVQEIRLIDLHHVAVFGPVQLSSAAIQSLCERDIAIAHFTLGGWFYGLTRGHNLTNVFTRIEQFAHAGDPDKALIHARIFVHGKIRNQRTLLMRNHLDAPKSALRELKYAASAALVANDLQSLLGVEGSAARIYFQHFSGMIKSSKESPSAADQNTAQQEFPFRLDQRNRRPPRDPVNAMLSLGYALLARECTVSAWSTGFDPYVGFLHLPRYGRPSLALDVMEEFRPLVVDSTVLTLINNRMVEPGDFIRAGNTVTLSQRGRKAFITVYEKRLHQAVTHPVFGYKVSYRRCIELQFRLLAKCLTGEIEQYHPFMTR